MLNQANAEELAKIANETGALVLHGQLRYPGPESGDWEIGMDSVPDALYPLRDRLALLILAAVDGQTLDLCGLCGFALSGPGEPCPRCALADEDVASALDGRRVVGEVEQWLAGEQEQTPHPLEAELGKIQAALDALDACPPVWRADRLLWRGLRWFYKMRLRRIGESLRI